MHISDTTEEAYKYIMKVVEEINPQYIVHTGDIVDNIKLETNYSYLHLHQKGLKKFIDSIEKYRAKIYYVLGNHDDKESVEMFSSRGIILERGIIEIEGKTFYVSHKYKKSNANTDYYLFGHSFEPGHCKDKDQILLNGVLNMSVISLSTGNIYQIEYRMGINYYRKMERGSIGL